MALLPIVMVPLVPITLVFATMALMWNHSNPTAMVFYGHEASRFMYLWNGREYVKDYMTLEYPSKLRMPRYHILNAPTLRSDIFYINDNMKSSVAYGILKVPEIERICTFNFTVDRNTKCIGKYSSSPESYYLDCGNELIRIHGFNNFRRMSLRGKVQLVPCDAGKWVTRTICFNETTPLEKVTK